MSWTLTSSAAAISKAGVSANSTIVASTATLALWSDQAEGVLNAVTHYDWTSNYGSVGTNFTGILSEAVSSLVAMDIINYDMSGFTSRLEAQTMLDVLRDSFMRCADSLKENGTREVMV